MYNFHKNIAHTVGEGSAYPCSTKSRNLIFNNCATVLTTLWGQILNAETGLCAVHTNINVTYFNVVLSESHSR